MNRNEQLNKLFELARQGKKPKEIMQYFVDNDKQLQILINQAKQSGMEPKDYVFQYAKQNNINLNPIFEMFIRNGVIKL